MKTLSAAALGAATLTAGLALSAQPAAAAMCGCHVVRHHVAHRVIHRAVVYRTVRIEREDVVYVREPHRWVSEAYDDDPAYAAGPDWTNRTGYDDGPIYDGRDVTSEQRFESRSGFDHHEHGDRDHAGHDHGDREHWDHGDRGR